MSAVVEVGELRRRVLTDSAGRFVIRGIAPGRFTLAADALGYEARRLTVQVPSDAVPVIRLDPRPIPLAAIQALVRPQSRSVRGMRVRVYGREQFLSGDDISAATFVHEKVHLRLYPCAALASGFIASPYMEAGSTRIPDAGNLDLAGEECIESSRLVFVQGRAGGRYVRMRWPLPVIVYVDGQRLASASSELNAHRVWDLARIEVFTSGTPAAAVVRLVTKGFVERTAARMTHLCEDLAGLDPSDPERARKLYSLCAP